MPNGYFPLLNHFIWDLSASTGTNVSKCVPGVAQLLKLIGLISQYCNAMNVTLCADEIQISLLPSIQSLNLHYSSLSRLLAFFYLLPYPSPSLPFFLFVLFSPLTMGGLRLLHVGGVGFLRVIAGPGAHRNIQINAVTWSPLKSGFHLSNPDVCSSHMWGHRSTKLCDLLRCCGHFCSMMEYPGIRTISLHFHHVVVLNGWLYNQWGPKSLIVTW